MGTTTPVCHSTAVVLAPEHLEASVFSGKSPRWPGTQYPIMLPKVTPSLPTWLESPAPLREFGSRAYAVQGCELRTKLVGTASPHTLAQVLSPPSRWYFTSQEPVYDAWDQHAQAPNFACRQPHSEPNLLPIGGDPTWRWHPLPSLGWVQQSLWSKDSAIRFREEGGICLRWRSLSISGSCS